MINDIVSASRKALLVWIDLVHRAAWFVVVLSLLSAAAATVYIVRNLSINSDTSEMLSKELSFRKLSTEMDTAFPQFSDNILIVVDGDTPDLADDAALRLTMRLREQPKLFGEIFYPEADPFFRRNGLLFSSPEDLMSLSDHLAKAQPFLVSLWQDPSLRGLFDLLTLALANTGKVDSELKLGGVLDAVATVAESQISGRFAQLSWRTLMVGKDKNGNGHKVERRLILIQPSLDFSSLHPARRTMEAVRTLAAELTLDQMHGVRVRMTGSVALAEEELQSVESSMGLANVLSLIMVAGLLLIGLKSLRLVIPVFVTLLVGLVWTTAFALLTVGEFNLISVAFAVLFIGLGVDFGIHFSLRYREGIEEGKEHADALRWAAAGVGGPLTLCATAAAIGFFSFLPTDYRGFAELGLIAGSGMFIALFANMSLLPALLTLAPLQAKPNLQAMPSKDPDISLLESAVLHHGRTIVVSSVVLAIVAAFLAPGMRFDFDPLHLRDPQSESVSTLYDLMEDNRANPYSISILAPNLEEARALAERLKKLDLVRDATTINDYVPTQQEDKLDIISIMAVFLAPLQTPAHPIPITTAGRKTSVAALIDVLATRTDDSSRRLHGALLRLAQTGDGALSELESRLLASLPAQLTAMRTVLTAEPFTLRNLPAPIRDREIAADGRTRVEVFPKDDPHDHTKLRHFVSAVHSVAPNAIGSPVVIVEAGKAVIGAFQTATLITLALLTIMLAVLLRNLRDALLVFAPLLLASLLTAATATILNIPINFANVIILPLLFGIGIANGIQFVYRERLESDPIKLLRTSTPRAVVFSALTTIASLGSMAVSSHPGTASMGILLCIALTYTLLCTLVVLPSMMAFTRT